MQRLDEDIVHTLSPCEFSLASIHKPMYEDQIQTIKVENESNVVNLEFV